MPTARALQIRPRARIDLADIYAYSREQWSIGQADIYQGKLTAAFLALASGERAGRETELGYLRLIVDKHLIFYSQDNRTITIVRVLHQSMDPDRHL